MPGRLGRIYPRVHAPLRDKIVMHVETCRSSRGAGCSGVERSSDRDARVSILAPTFETREVALSRGWEVVE
jgi:hypothetical protein